MEYNVRDDAMRLVIKYLTSVDLISASLACRSWMKIFYEETQKKGPKLVTQEIIINRYNRAVAKNDHVFVSTDMRPFLLLCFTNKDCNSDIAKRHMSKLIPDDCILVELKRNILEDVNQVWTILFPSSRSFSVSNLYFVTKFRVTAPELRWLDLKRSGRLSYVPRYFRQFYELLDWYNRMDTDPTFMEFILILFCTYSDIPQLIEIIAQLSTWYPSDCLIWGCTINSAQVFRNTLYKVPESFEVNCIQIYISGIGFFSKLLILNEHCNTKKIIRKKFEDFKSVVGCNENMIAFMCTSVARYKDFYEIESTAFKEIFPGVALAHIFSRRPFGAASLYEFDTYLRNIKPLEKINVTTLLIFPYY